MPIEKSEGAIIKPFVSYAQNLEDVFVQRCFGKLKRGRYIDVGASLPVRDSPTYACYERGWTGLLIEPITERVAELRRLRPRDITIRAAAGALLGDVTLFRSDGIGGLSSCVSASVDTLREMGSAIDRLVVPMVTLDAVCAAHHIEDVQLLKIDVEGFESDVLRGFAFDACRPELIIVEAFPLAPQSSSADWIDYLASANYTEVYDDGLNKYFVRVESSELAACFERPICVLDGALSYNAMGSCLRRTDHRDHEWAVHISEMLLQALGRMPIDGTFKMLTADVANAALDAILDINAINRGYFLVLARWTTETEGLTLLERARSSGLTLRDLIRELLDSEEYLARLARAGASI